MPTQIKQIDDAERSMTTFRVEGDLLAEDAELLGRLARDVHETTGNGITIDLADLDFLDSDSAAVLLKLEREHLFEIVGTEIFLQSVVNAAERRN